MAQSQERDFLVTDYFDDIKPSLLNSDDIHRYADEGWLVTEYDENRLLPAGYRLRFLGTLIRWKLNDDGDMERIEEDVEEDQPVKLYGNSISYLHMREEFRMPQYIAARFNLRIRHVHQGLLLGTGPIVDPGFSGSLLVPLHNLTGNSYSFMGGENFIHVEFTKLSPLRRWEKGVDPDSDHDDHYKPFPLEKITSSPDYYFNKAKVLENNGVVSNLAPLAVKVDAALTGIEGFKDGVEGTLRRNRFIGIGGVVALLALIITAFMMILQANSIYRDVRDSSAEVDAILDEARSLLADQPVSSIDGDAKVDAGNGTNDSLVSTAVDDLAPQPAENDGEGQIIDEELEAPNPDEGANKRKEETGIATEI